MAGAQANLALVTGDIARTLALSQRTVDLMPTSDTPWRVAAQVTSTLEYQMNGDVTPAAEQRMTAALTIVGGAPDLSVLAVSITANLGLLQLLQGRLRHADATFRSVPALVPSTHHLEALPSSRYYDVGLGHVLLEWNDLLAAEPHLRRAAGEVGGRIVVSADVVTMGYVGLARLRQAQGEHSAAVIALDAFADVARRRVYVPELVERGAAQRAELAIARGDVSAAVHWADGSGLSSEDVDLPFRREPAYLTLARVRIAQGQGEPGSSYLEEALRLLEQLRADADAKGRGHSLLEILILRALALHAQRATRRAVRTLLQVLALASPEGYVRLFADEGALMVTLLTELLDTAERRRLSVPATLLDYARFLMAICRASDGTAKPQAVAEAATWSPRPGAAEASLLLDPLTEREVEVLHMLAEGATNAAIAETLVVATGTVKKHVFNVCRKLGVQNRTQAVARARALHLL
jgi:LuxR family maltose regulon positive regulatory protein